MKSDEIKRQLVRDPPSEEATIYLSTGSTLLNLVCSGKPDGGFMAGRYYHIVGDSQSGKTWLSLTCFAEAANNPTFAEHRLIFDDVEGGALMNMERFFGAKMANRLEPPGINDVGGAVYSDTVESFYHHVDDVINDGRPFLYVLDSQDALSSLVEQGKFDESKDAVRRGKEITGSYGDAKAKAHSANLRRLMTPLRKSDSILIIISQTRDSFDPFVKSTYSGGRALQFYATFQMWSRIKNQIKRTVKGKPRQVGTLCEVRIRKNRGTGLVDRVVAIPIYFSFGIDDLGSLVEWMIDEKQWKKSGQKVVVEGLGPTFECAQESLIRKIGDDGMEDDLRGLVTDAWEEIEKGCEIKRKPRYE